MTQDDPRDPTTPAAWMLRARSNLAIAGAGAEDALYEDLCFEAQQAVEKALKALLIALEQSFPRTHDIDTLLGLLVKLGESVPGELGDLGDLSEYAVHTRYPTLAEPVTREEYAKALRLAAGTIQWVGERLGAI
ncbi:MAG: DNA-binding protein [Gemmatimonadetes bacterium]|nr:DNA-binding protein [Gemmatimonadota bacterium]